MSYKIKSLFKEINNKVIYQHLEPLYELNQSPKPSFKNPISKLDTNDIHINTRYFEGQSKAILNNFINNKNDYSIFLNHMQQLMESTKRYNNADPTPVYLTFESTESKQKETDFLYKNKSNYYQYDGVTKPYGYSNLLGALGVTVTQIEMNVDIASPYALCHEFGHVIDELHADDKYAYGSLDNNSDFIDIYEIIAYELKNHYPNIESDEMFSYYMLQPEMFARGFNIWYDKEVFQFHPNVNHKTLFDINDETYGKPKHIVEQAHPVEYTLYQIYDQYPEIQQFYTKHFGHIIPPENTKLYQKSKTETKKSLSDNEILQRLKDIEFEADLSPDSSSPNQINDIDY